MRDSPQKGAGMRDQDPPFQTLVYAWAFSAKFPFELSTCEHNFRRLQTSFQQHGFHDPQHTTRLLTYTHQYKMLVVSLFQTSRSRLICSIGLPARYDYLQLVTRFYVSYSYHLIGSEITCADWLLLFLC